MIVRLPEREFLADPTLWSSVGLNEWLTRQGFKPDQPYDRIEGEHELVFIQHVVMAEELPSGD